MRNKNVKKINQRKVGVVEKKQENTVISASFETDEIKQK